ncbi:MAG: hypothetical protein IJX26_00155, partial [Clostridia bacterium]|nr:hypothetical protein [Clostridia bacterium]
EYSPYPNIANAESSGNSYNSTTYAEQYPVLTYDYKRYNMKFTYMVNDSTTNVSVEYDEDENQLKVVSETNGIKDKSPLSYQCQSSNSLVSFVFASMGSYSFEFNYVYYYDDKRLVINNIDIPKLELNIYGYQLEYPKTDFASSNLRYLEIIKNSTTVIPYKGYTNNTITPDPSLELGYMYSFVEPVDSDPNLKISGNIKSSTTADLTNKIENSVTIDESKLSEKKISLTGLDKFEYINTDQTGLWLNLTDLYNLSESYYIYSPIRLKDGTSYDAKTIEKTTKFKSAGYYFIKASYKVEDLSYFQYFAFRLSSATVSARLYKTKSETYPQISSVGDITDTQIYSNQFTNKNVYAYWEEPYVFESKQTVRLIYAKTGNVYRSKETLLNYLNGEPNANLTSEVYEKGKRIITENGSYLLSVSIDGTQIVSNSFFTIDKQDISGIEVLGVSSAVIGNTTVYNVARDSSNNSIKYTNKSLINKNFCLWWNNKSSGAEITAKYTFTPILSSGAGSNKITGTENEVNYVWLTTNYKLGKTSTELKIEKPLTQLATVNPEYVLTNQGIYWFTLEDSAGNSVNYMVVIDRTELIVSATSMGNEVLNGEMVAEDVSLEWGTHKAIDLESKELKDLGDNSIWSLMFNIFIKGEENSYYKASNSNLNAFKSVVKATSTSSSANLYLVVKNEYAKLTYSDHQLTINSNGSTSSTSGSWANITNINSHSLTIGLKSNEERYVLYVYGENQIKEQGLSNSSFTVTLNPDKSEGSIKSTSGEDSGYNKVYSYNNSYTTESEFTKNFLNGQASDDNLFVFEWLSGEGSEYEVGEVYYDYYPLMTQSELNAYESGNANYAYYPYSSQSSRYYIYGGENNAQNYIVTSVNGKTICRSNVLNTGYVLDYDETGNLVSMDATLPGMYVVTREYASATNSEFDSQVRKYVFFVDRNNIVEYSTANISVKLVGEHIDILSQEKVVFSNYTQEVNTLTVGNNSYNIHLKSNRLPLQIRIPTGKYSSKVGDSIIHTSNSNSAGLKFNIYFVDTNNYLGLGANSFFKLFAMDNMMKNGSSFVTNGYIIYKLTSSSLYQGENNHSQEYLNACVQTGSDWLSLPGSYIIEIKDNVGKTIKENSTNVVEDCNVFLIGVEVEQSKPNINLYASQTTGNTGLTYANYSETKTSFDSSKAYVRYELPFEDTTSFKAQIDKDYIYITRTDGTKTEVYYSSITGGGIINKDTQFNDGENNISYIQMLSDKVVVLIYK